jgi:O-antigen ligase
VFSKLIFFQVLVGLTFPVYIVLAWMEPTYRPRFHLLYAAIGAYFVAVGLSMIFAVDPLRAWWGNQERMNGLFTLLHFLAWLTMAVSVLKTWDQWRRLLNYEVVLSAIMAIVALLQKVNPNLLLFPAGPRVGGLLDNPIYMGAYQIFNLFFLALLMLKTRSKGARIWYAVLAFIDVSAFVAAQSRGALLGLGAGIVVFALWYALFTKSKKTRYSILGIAACIFVAYGLLFALRDTAIIRNSAFHRLVDFSGSVETRFIAWRIAWQGFLERPLTGWGFDNFHILFNQHYNPESLRFGTYETWFDRAHNTVLDVLSMTGIFGFVTFFGIFAALFYSVWRAFKQQWIDLTFASILVALPVAYFVQNLFVFDHPAGFSMSFLLYALTIAATRPDFIKFSTPAEDTKMKRSFSWTLFGVLQLAFILLVWRTSILPFQASRLSIKANNAFGSPQAMEYMQAAAHIWTPYLDEQTFLISRNILVYAGQGALTKITDWKERYTLAKQLTEEELARHPRNTHPHYIYAQLAMGMLSLVPQDAPIVEKQYLLAIDTSPKRQQLYFGLANLYVAQGRVDEALELYRKVRDFDPDLGEGHWMYGLALFYDKQDHQTGATELALSQSSKFRYVLRDGRELIPLADAYTILNDVESFRKLADRITEVPQGQAVYYVQLAYKYHQAKMFEERDRVLNYAISLDPRAKATFDQMVQGKPADTSGPRR